MACKQSKDQLYGWVVVAVSFIGQSLSIGFFYSFGTIYVALMREYGVNETEAAWVGSAAYAMCLFSGYGISYAAKKCGCRKLFIGGGLLSGLGFLLSSYVENFNVLYVTYGVLVAFGLSNAFFCSLFVLPMYFHRKLSFANGLVSSGGGFGALAISPLLEYLIRNYSFKTAMSAYSMTSFLLVVGGIFYTRSRDPAFEDVVQKRTDILINEDTDTKIFKNKSYLLWTFCLALILFGNYIPFVHLVNLAEHVGISSQKAALVPGYMSLSQSIGKWIFGHLADNKRINRLIVFQFSLLGSAIAITLCPLFTSFPTLVFIAVILGFFDGCFCSYIFILTADVVKVKQINDAFGLLYTLTAGFSLLGPPFAGFLYRSSGSYQLAFTVCGVNLIISICIMFLIPFFLPNDVILEKQEHIKLPNHDDTSEKCRKDDKRNSKEHESHEKDDSIYIDSGSKQTTKIEITFDTITTQSTTKCRPCKQQKHDTGLAAVAIKYLDNSRAMQWKGFVASSMIELTQFDDTIQITPSNEHKKIICQKSSISSNVFSKRGLDYVASRFGGFLSTKRQSYIDAVSDCPKNQELSNYVIGR